MKRTLQAALLEQNHLLHAVLAMNSFLAVLRHSQAVTGGYYSAKSSNCAMSEQLILCQHLGLFMAHLHHMQAECYALCKEALNSIS